MMPFSPTTRRTRQRPMPPGPVGYPWLGVLPQMRRDSLRFLTAMARTYGGIVSLPLGPLRAYLFCHPDHIAYILQDNHRNYAKSQFMEQVKPLLGEGLVTSDGDMWRTQRRLVQPAFHRQRIAALAGTITTATQDML